MEFGFYVPYRGPIATPEHIATMAQRGEALGFDIIAVADHVVIPRSIGSRYPYSESGAFAGQASGDCLEVLTTLTFLAGLTSRIRLLTSILVLPYRPPVLSAKMLATLDVLSKGRLIVGCGAGWLQEEFEALGAPPFDQRGATTDEYIAIFKELWTSDEPHFDGTYSRFANISFSPKPVQQPHPPIWIGGESPAALRRTARAGDVWYPIGGNPRFPLETPEQMAASIARLRGYAKEAGRDPDAVGVAYSARWYNDPQAHTLPNGKRRAFTGEPRQIADDIRRWQEAGLRYLLFHVDGSTMEGTLARMEILVNEVRPLVP